MKTFKFFYNIDHNGKHARAAVPETISELAILKPRLTTILPATFAKPTS